MLGLTGPGRLTAHGLDSLQARMAVLVGLVLLGPTMFAGAEAVRAHRERGHDQVELLQRTAMLAASEQAQRLNAVAAGLAVLAPRLHPGDDCASPAALPAGVTAMAALDLDGRLLCGPAGLISGTAVMAARIGPTSADPGRTWAELVPGADELVIFVPLPEVEQGAVTIVARVNAAWPSPVAPPDRAAAPTLALLDPTAADALAGGRLPFADFAPRSVDERTGRHRWLAASEVAPFGLVAVASLPAPTWSWAERDLLVGLYAPFVTLLLAVLTVWTACDVLVIRHLRRLAGMATSDGRLVPSTGDLAGAPAELRQVGVLLADMTLHLRTHESELQAALEHKGALLREVHHRVKNNLQIVNSLFNLRARALPPSPTRRAMVEAHLRIKALALVNRYLYEGDDVTAVELSLFLPDLCAMLRESADLDPGQVALTVKADEVQVPTDAAIPIALFITETVSNAFSHAFPDGRTGTIAVGLSQRPDGARLVVRDDGVGLPVPADATSNQGRGLGLTLVGMLARQVGGTVTIAHEAGTWVTLDFPSTAPFANSARLGVAVL